MKIVKTEKILRESVTSWIQTRDWLSTSLLADAVGCDRGKMSRIKNGIVEIKTELAEKIMKYMNRQGVDVFNSTNE